MTNIKKETIQERTKHPPFLILFLGLLTALTPLSIDMYLPALPMMREVFQTNPSNIQLTLSMTVIGIAIGQLFGGPISDIFGRKRPLIIGNILCALATLACALSQSIEGLLPPHGRQWPSPSGSSSHRWTNFSFRLLAPRFHRPNFNCSHTFLYELGL